MQNNQNEVLSILKDIIDNIELQEHHLEKKYKLLSSYIESDKVKNLLNEFSVYTDNLIQENRCQEIIHLLLIEICNQQNKLKELLSKCKFIEYPSWAYTLEILKEENCIVNYIRDSVYCFKEDKYGLDYLANLTGKSLKEELISYVDKETQREHFEFYDNFSEEDYNKAIKFVRIEMNNDNVSELNYNLDELERFTTLFKLFDYNSPRNIYASALVDIITAISLPVQNIIKHNYPDVTWRGNKLTSALISLWLKHSECFNIDGKCIYVDIMEFMERRNMYIHNQGFVNDKYLGFGAIIQSDKWNLKGFQSGDFLQINGYYFQDAYDLIKKFIQQL